MAKIIIEGSKDVLNAFAEWFSNSGEQQFNEAWNMGDISGIYPTTEISVQGYGIYEPIRLVEYDLGTGEEVKYD
ncbi:hypothetical protein ABGQ50_000155 [Shigella flexneri]